MRKPMDFIRPYTFKITGELLLKSIGTLGELMLPYLLSYMIDQVIPKKSLSEACAFGAVMFLMAILSGVIHVITNRLSAKISSGIGNDLRIALFDRVCRFNGSQTERFTVTEISDRITADTYVFTDGLAVLQRGGVRIPLIILGSILMMILLDSALAVLMAAASGCCALLLFRLSGKGIRLFEKAYARTDEMVCVLREDLLGIRVIKASLGEQTEKKRFQEHVERAYQETAAADKSMAGIKPLLQSVLYVCMTMMLLAGAWRIQSGAMGPGDLIAFMTYVVMVQGALAGGSRILIWISKISAAGKRMEEILDAAVPEEKDNGISVSDSRLGSDSDWELFLQNVSFSFPECQNVLNGLTFGIRKGETLGIIGSTGSGKSTLVKLLLGFYTPQKGSLFLRGRDSRKIPAEELRKSFSVVFQDDCLFEGTIADNIRFFRKNLSMDRIVEGARLAGALDFIWERKDGFREKVEHHGQNFSGGQKQRILLARALAEPRDILLMDDSFSALDYQTEREVRKNIFRAFPGQTKILISQRIAGIAAADRILVLEKGKIAGIGTHRELLASCGVYREIYQTQGGNGCEEEKKE